MSQHPLARSALFASLPPDELARLGSTLPLRALQPNTILFHEGDTGEHVYVVADGEVAVVKAYGTPGERLLALRGTGEIVGELSLLNPDGQRTASVITRGPVEVYEIGRADFDRLLQRQPALAYDLVRMLSARLTAAQTATIRDLEAKNRELEQANRELLAAQAQIIEKERLERELQVAHEIQLSILPRTAPRLAGYDFAAHLIPARAVGGDFFDFIPLGDDRLGIAIGDVTDKGVPAAIFMAQTRALLRAEALRAGSPSDALQRVNSHLLDMNDQSLFVTVVYGILDGRSGAFTYARAGHEAPLLGRGGNMDPLPEGDALPLGIAPDPPLDEQTIALGRGDLLVLYTNGVTDARNAQGLRFGIARLKAALTVQNHTPAETVCAHLLEAIAAHQGTAAQHDDITLVAMCSA